MIFVTIGTQPFPRLIKKMDEIAGKINEKVIMQIGYTKYKPKNAEYFDFKSYQEIQELILKSRVVVCHGGIGTIITALMLGTPVIAVPRLKEYGEVIDDQQLETVKALARKGLVYVVYNVDQLERILRITDIKPVKIKVKKDKRVVNFLREYIMSLCR